jgi:hypothetical protein
MNRFKISATILTIIVLITVSCDSSKKDQSLTAEEYEKMGMPDHTKLWSNKAYTQAFNVLSKVKLNNPLSYPRKDSRKSGVVFSRFVNKENLSFLDDPSISLIDKAFEMQTLSSAQSTLRRKYTDEFRTEQYYNEELIETYIFGLYVQERMFELARIILNSDDVHLANMKAGIKMVANGYVQLSCLLLGEQIKSDVYKKKGLDRLSTEMARSLKDNLKWLEPADLQKITVSIQNAIEKAPTEYVKNQYQEVLEAIKKLRI